MTPNIHLPPALASSVAIACRMRALELRHCVDEINRIAAIPDYPGNLEVERARAAAITAEAVALETFAKRVEIVAAKPTMEAGIIHYNQVPSDSTLVCSHRYTSVKGCISLIEPTSHTSENYEIYCIDGGLFEDVERFSTLDEAMTRIRSLLQ